MEAKYEELFKPTIAEEIYNCIKKYDGITSVIDSMGVDRGAGIFTQFGCIFVRNVQYVTRSPRALHGVAF